MGYKCIFLHQTTTPEFFLGFCYRCISLYSYIKPQLFVFSASVLASCISLYSYIKPQLELLKENDQLRLYIPIFLHQTTTTSILTFPLIVLYIPIFLHQTTTGMKYLHLNLCCISLYSYIKPQHVIDKRRNAIVVYPYIPTSNHNIAYTLPPPVPLYIPIFLHQTTTLLAHSLASCSCISLYSYIKPQRIHIVYF